MSDCEQGSYSSVQVQPSDHGHSIAKPEIDLTVPGSEALRNGKWEAFCKAVSLDIGPDVAYMRVWGISKRVPARRMGLRLLRVGKVKDRILFLAKGREVQELAYDNFDIRAVKRTCLNIIRNAVKDQSKLAAIETLNKLGVFDDARKKDNEHGMDPAALCEYLASFARQPAVELKKIPGGLSGMLKSLMELTGATKEDVILALDADIQTRVIPPQSSEDDLAEPDVGEDEEDDGDDGNDDGEIDDDEVFMETIKSSANSDVNNEDAKSLSTPPAVPDAKEAPLPPRPARVKEAITPEILERLQPALDFAKLDPQARKEIYDNLNAKRAGDISGV